MANGRRAADEPLPTEIDAAEASAGRERSLRAGRSDDRRFRGDVERPAYCRAVRARPNAQTPLEGWSMGKSVTATLFGILVKDRRLRLITAGTDSEWQTPGDPRAKIRIADILHMSSGLRIKAPQDPDYDPSGPYPDHIYLYTGGINSFHYAATRPLQWPPNTIGRYHNTDPVLINYLIRLGGRETRRGLSIVPAAGAVRQARHPHNGDRN